MKNAFTQCACIAIAIAVFANTALFASPNAKNAGQKAPLSFVENRGQVTDQQHQQRHDIQFRLPASGGLNIFVGSGAIHYQFSKPENNNAGMPDLTAPHDAKKVQQPVNYIMDRMDVELVGANKNAKVIKGEEQVYSENYFTEWSGPSGVKVHAYNRVTYKDIYPNIDWVLYTANGQLKHEFVVRAGGKVSDIKLKYGGAKELWLNTDGSLTASTPQGTIKEHAPKTYQKDGKAVSSSFRLNGDVVSYETGSYAGELIIDPTLLWATYYGGSGDDQFLAIVADPAGNVAMTGYTTSASSVATTGAYQTTFGGVRDAMIVKFNSAGARLWATYYGGSDLDQGFGIAADAGGSLYVAGQTSSASGIATAGAHQTTLGSTTGDAFLVKFSADGFRIWGTYYGGTSTDEGRAVTTDGSGNVYLGGTTASSSGISTPGTFQTTNGGGMNDAFAVKFNSSGTRQWGTYFGSSGIENGDGIAVDGSGNVFLGGYSFVGTGMASPGAFQTTPGAAVDGILLKLDNTGNRVWSTYYGGSGDDVIYDISADAAGNVYFGGYTFSSGLASSGAYQTTMGSTSDAIVGKFDGSGARQWVTYYGGNGSDILNGIKVDGAGNVYITGATGSTTAITTGDGYLLTPPGGGDAFVAEINNAGTSLLYGTYFGGTPTNDVGFGVAVDGAGNVYMAGIASSATGIATSGAYQTTHGGGSWDGMLAKFNMCTPPVVAPVTGPSTVCNGGTITLANITSGGTWSSGNPGIATVSSGGVVTGVAAGNVIISYTVVSGGCPGYATAKVIVGQNIVSTIAGAGLAPGYTGDGGPATSSQLQRPTGIAVDPSGNVYIADNFNDAIRRISTSGTITTIAGTGTGGAGADGIAATASAIDGPFEIALDGAGNIYFTDGLNHRVRKIDLLGVVTTIAGVGTPGFSGDAGPATAAELNRPAGIAIDASGNIYIGDEMNNRVRRIATDGTISTFAGTGTGGFSGDGVAATTTNVSQPTYICIDPSGNVVIADKGGVRIRSVNSSGIISTIAGNGVSGATGDGAAATAARLSEPAGMAYDGAGNLYFADQVNHRVRVINTSGIINAFAGAGIAGYSGDGGPATAAWMAGTSDVAFDLDGNLLISEYTSHVIRKISPAPVTLNSITGGNTACEGGFILLANTTPGGAWTSSNPAVATVSTTGVVSAVGAGTATITYTVTFGCGAAFVTHAVTINAFSAGTLSGPSSVCPNGTITLTTTGSGGVWSSSNPAVATVSGTGVVTGVGTGNTVISYTVVTGCGTIAARAAVSVGARIINTVVGTGTGGFAGDGGQATAAQINQNYEIFYDGATGNLYIADQNNNRIRRVNTTTGIISTICGIAGGGGFGGDGAAATLARLNGAVGVTVDGTGNIYIADAGNNRIRRINTSGIITTVAGTGTGSFTGDGGQATAATLNGPRSVLFDGSGNMIINDGGNNRIRRVDASTGVITTIVGNNSAGGFAGDGGPATAARLNTPRGMSFDGAGNLYIADLLNNRIRKVTMATGIITTVVGTGMGGSTGDGGSAATAQVNNPASVIFDPAGNMIITESAGHRVRSVNASGIISTIVGTGTAGTTGNGGSPSAAQINAPRHITFTPAGNFYISCLGGNNVRLVKASTPPTFVGGDRQGLTVCMGSSGNSINTLMAISDTDRQQTETWSVFTLPVNGTVVGATTGTSNGGTLTPTGLTYTPTPGYSGLDSFTIQVSDGCATTTTVIVTVNTAPAPPPITGTLSTCIGTTTTLSNAMPGGTWSSSAPSIATVGTSGVVLGVSGGASIITYTVTNACGSGFVIATVLVSTTGGSITGTLNVCPGSTTTLTGSPSGGTWTSGNVAVATAGSSTGVITGVTSGTSTITYTHSGGCSTTAVVTVDPLPGPISGTTTICIGGSTILTAPPAGGTWTSGTPAVATIDPFTGVVGGISAGTADITYTVSSGCSVSTTVTVNPPPAAITPAGAISLCIGGSRTLADATPGGTWSSSSIAIVSVNTSGVITAMGVGVATITYSTGIGCIATKDITVNITPATLSPASASVCIGNSTTLTNSVPGGTWTTSAGGIASVTSGVVTGVSAGTANISYTIGTCFVIAPVTVSASPSAITPAGAVNMCVGATAALADATPGGTWSSGATGVATVGTSGIVTGVSAGSATISYTNSLGCSVTKTVVVDPTPAGVTPSSTTVCTGNTVTLTDAVGGGTWTSDAPGVASVAGGVVTGVTVGTANITYAIGACTSTATVTVALSPDAGTITGPASVCTGGTITLADASPGGVWSSSDAAVAAVGTAGVVSGIAAGTATISYTVTNGCGSVSATHPVAVNISPSAGTIVGLSMICAGSVTMLVDTVAGGVWSVTTGNASITPAGLLTGVTPGLDTVYYTVTNACGTVSTSHPLTVGLFLTAGTITGPSDVCQGATITLADTTPGGVWSSSNTAIATVSSSGVVTGTGGGNVTISYTVTSGCGSVSATHVVSVTATPNAGTISGPIVLCAGMTATYTTTGSGGVWDVTNTTATITSGGVLTAVSVGTDTVTYVVTNTCGTSSAMRAVTIGAAISAGVISGPNNVCVGATITLTDPAPGGAWSSSNSNATVIAGMVTGVAAGTSTISYTVTGSCGSVSATHVVTINPLANAGTISGPTSVCTGSTITLTNSAPGGVWSASNSNATVSGGVVTGVSVGTVLISYTVTNGCGPVSAVQLVSVNTLPVAGVLTGPGNVCEAAAIILTPSVSGGTWSASNANATVVGGVVSGVTAGTSTISYTVTNMCGSTSATKVMTIDPLPVAGAISGATDVCVGSTITLIDAVPGGVWSASNTNATVSSGGVVTGVSAGTVTISYSVTNMCGTVSATSLITINPLPDAGAITGGTNVCVGGALLLTDLAPGGVWSASNGNATVTGGLVTGVSTGLDTISYTVTNVCGIAIAAVIVNVSTVPTVAAISGPATVCKTASITLANATTGGVWSASNSRATVTSAGVVTGVTAGLDTIMYTVTNTCGSTVASKVITVTQTPNPGSISGASGVCIGLSITLSNPVSGGTWSSSNSSLATVSGGGVVTGIAAGPVTITYTVTNSCGSRTATHGVAVLTPTQCNTMINGVAKSYTEELQVYPNPNQGVFTMNVLTEQDMPVTVVITNIIGKKVKEFTTTTNKATEVQMNTSPGIYLLTATTVNGRHVSKVTVE